MPGAGDTVWIRQRRWRVDRAQRHGAIVRLDVSSIDRRATFFTPFDRPTVDARPGRPRRVRRQQALARLAGLIARAPDPRLPLSALDAGVDILPHQLEPVLATLAGRTRLLIADEVGLGKTIQAGLILAEWLRREPRTRALIVVPLPLRDQWADELRARFGIEAMAADRDGLDELSRAGAFGDNPWQRAGVWLASADYLKQRHVLDAMPATPWDLLVIDEAHGVCGDSARHAACDRLAARSRRVVLLTATPHSGDDARFARLVSLGDLTGLARPGEHRDAMVFFRRNRREMQWAPRRAVRWLSVRLSTQETAALDGLAAFERAVVGPLTHGGVSANEAGGSGARLLLAVFRKRALSTFAALAQSIRRRLDWLDAGETGALPDWAQLGLRFDDADDDDARERTGLCASTGLTPARERAWLRRLRDLADRAALSDSKVARIANLVGRTTEPVIVFTEFRDSLDTLARRLIPTSRLAILHGQQDDAMRRNQLTAFLRGDAAVLLATDVASHGLNLQARARWVMSLELPWNPARLEQRIGRVDRIGQRRSTHLTLIVARHPAERGLLLHLAGRVLSAQRAVGGNVLGDVMPSEAAVGDAIFAVPGATLPEIEVRPRSASVASARWRRAAIVTARALQRRRALADRWREAGPGTRGPVWTVDERLRGQRYDADSLLVVLSVPVFDAQDDLVAECLAPVAVRAATSDQIDAALIDTLTSALPPRLFVRDLARSARTLMRCADGLDRRDELIRRALLADGKTEAQRGLFDRRELRAFDAQAANVSRALADLAARVQRRSRGPLRLGPPRLDVALLTRS